MTRRRLIHIPLLLLVLVGCTSTGEEEPGVREPVLEKPAPPSAAKVLDIKVPREDSLVLTLSGATYLALGRNRSLASLRAEVDRKTGLLIQADTAPNPRITVAPQAPLGDAILVGGSVEISQLLEMGKRSARAESAGSDREVARALYFLRRNQVLLELKEAFADIRAAAEEVTLRRSLVDQLDRLHKLADNLFKEGRRPEKEVLEARVSLARARVALARSQRALADAKRVLEALCDLPPRSVRSVEGALGRPAALPAESLLQRRTLRDNPYLLSLDRKTALARSRLKAAEIKPIPDVRVGARYTRKRSDMEDSHVVGLTLSVPVPLWDRNQGSVRAFRHAIEALGHDRREGENAALLRLSKALNRHRENLGRVREFEAEVLPALEKVLSLAVLERQAGRASTIDVYQAQVGLLKARIEVLAFRRACALARAEVESIIGGEMK